MACTSNATPAYIVGIAVGPSAEVIGVLALLLAGGKPPTPVAPALFVDGRPALAAVLASNGLALVVARGSKLVAGPALAGSVKAPGAPWVVLAAADPKFVVLVPGYVGG
jgi:hypothetical protein